MPKTATERQRSYRSTAKGKAATKRNNTSPKGKARIQRYRRSEKGKAANLRAVKNYRNKLRRQTAAIPTPVIRPFVDRMLAEIEADSTNPKARGGRGRHRTPRGLLAEFAGLSVEDVYNITKSRPIKKVRVDVADKLAIFGDFTLTELYERAEEWALLTGDPWPEGYYHRWQ